MATRDLIVDTKLYPNGWDDQSASHFTDTYTHKPEDIRQGLMASLEALKTDKIDMIYLHAPDRKTPFEGTLCEVNRLHERGLFVRFGLSNFMAWEVAQICEICQKHDWIMPTVYQRVYHVLQRSIESELLPCLRKYNISLYAFQPLAGGLLTGRYKRDQTEFEEGPRFDHKTLIGSAHQKRYRNEAYFDALQSIEDAIRKYNLTSGKAALRWLKYHSQLSKHWDDAII